MARKNGKRKLKGRYGRLPVDVMRSSVSGSAKAVYAALDSHDTVRYGCFPNIATLANDVGLSVVQVKRALKALRDEGFISSWRAPGRGNHYRLHGDSEPAPAGIVDDTGITDDTGSKSDPGRDHQRDDPGITDDRSKRQVKRKPNPCSPEADAFAARPAHIRRLLADNLIASGSHLSEYNALVGEVVEIQPGSPLEFEAELLERRAHRSPAEVAA